MIALDDIDYAIINCLKEDARMSSLEMTRRIGNVSDRVVRYRLRRLLDNRVVLLNAIVSPFAVGYPIIADILVEVVPWKLEEVSAKLAAMPSVCYVSSAYAGRHLSVEVNACDETEVMSFVYRHLRPLEGVMRTETMIVPRVIKDIPQWDVPR
jgi:Lrp/AsnC family leucine-responsive transcriptional regulator